MICIFIAVNAVVDYINGLEGAQRDIMFAIHEMLSSYPDVTSKLRYKIPFYDRKSWVCYLNPVKPDGIELAFIHGKELSNVQGILQIKGRKQIMGIELFSLHDIPIDSIQEVLMEAFLLDDEKALAKQKK